MVDNFKELIAEAKNRFKSDQMIMDCLNEMEDSFSNKHRIKAALLMEDLTRVDHEV